nr:unnamed protein product [Callosobruchus chinensis]
MREEDINRYKNNLRMLSYKFDELLSKIESSTQKQDTHMRNADRYEHAQYADLSRHAKSTFPLSRATGSMLKNRTTVDS